MDSIFTLQAHLQGVLLWGFLATAVLTAGLETSQKFGIYHLDSGESSCASGEER